MKRLNGSEKGALILASALILGGAFMAICPKEKLFVHGAQSYRVHLSAETEHISKGEDRLSGLASILVGTGIIWLTLFRAKR
jgi:uncharacterized protein YjeT (DUF2065 family)